MTSPEIPGSGDGTRSATASRSASRSGCAVVSGVLLIAVGSLFLANNFLSVIGLSSLRVGLQVLVWYGAYWPLLFIGWGAYKIFERFKRPNRSYVTAPEIVILTWILVSGLAIRGVARIAEDFASEVSLEDFASLFGTDLLGPAHQSIDDASFDLGDTTVLVIDNGHGQVVVRGSDEPRLHVTVTKQLHGLSTADVERAFAAVNLELSSDGERDHRRLQVSRVADGRGVRTDLEIRVPRDISVRVSNRRGGVRLEDLTALAEIKTTQGDVEATNLSAGLDVETTHATIRLERISGHVIAKNQHGAIHASNVEGDVTATTEHSKVIAEGVGGTVRLRTDHGSVRAADVTGNVEIESPYSEVSVERAGGDVSITASQRPVFISDVGGGLELAARSARILVRGVARDVSIEGRHRPVSVANVGGSVSVIGEQNAVEIESVAGAVTIQSSDEPVYVTEFDGGLAIRTSHADVEIVAGRISDAIEIQTSYGNVSLALPVGANVRLRASNRDGGFRSEFAELAGESDGNGGNDDEQRWEGAMGSAIHPVTLTTSYGDIAVTRMSR